MDLVVSAPFTERTILSTLNGLGTLVENQLSITVRVYFCALGSILLTSMSILMPVLHCLDYCCFVVSFELRKCGSSRFVLLQDYLGYLGSLVSM